MALQRLARGADKVTQHGNVGAVGSDPAGIHGQTEALGEIEIHAGVVQFGQAESLRRQYTIRTRRVYRPWRPVPLPRAPRQFIKLLPIAFVPSGHAISLCVLLNSLDAWAAEKVLRALAEHPSRAIDILHNRPAETLSFSVVSNTLRGELFRAPAQ
jgi:hypothetical protein